jgi:FKBP-type peptidyl-prolyl cis-trans isomerase
MRVGERFEFAIPWNLAYGWNGRGPIPGGATLLFTIDLIRIAAPAQ